MTHLPLLSPQPLPAPEALVLEINTTSGFRAHVVCPSLDDETDETVDQEETP